MVPPRRLARSLAVSVTWFVGLGGLLAVGGCGGLPRPFEGNPGATALRLAQPPPARLVVEPASAALLSNNDQYRFANALAASLDDREVPAVPAFGRQGEWRLVTTADLRNGQVVPHYAVQDPKGAVKGGMDGAPVDANAWATPTPDLLKHEAELATPGLVTLLDHIEAQREQADPHSLLNRPPRVLVGGVIGAPGDGNASLALEMGRELAKKNEVVVDTRADADFIVSGHVNAVPVRSDVTRIELIWTVMDMQGHENGKIVQLNEVPTGFVSGLWGDTAIAAAQEAAGGVQEVILKFLESRRDSLKPKPGS